MPNPPLDKRADAHSREMEFAGLPKIIKAVTAANQGPLVAPGWTAISLDSILFNYGPYHLQPQGLGYQEIVVEEPGIYHVTGGLLTSVAGGLNHYMIVYIGVNSLGVAGAGFIPGYPRIDQDAERAGNPSANISGYLELKARDSISLNIFSTAACLALAGYAYVTVKKEGGQY